MARLKFVETETTRHGKTVVYFRRDKGERIRLPDDQSSAEFRRHYFAALQGRPIAGVIPPTKIELRKQRTEKSLKQALRGAAARSRKRRLAFDIDMEWALAAAEAQNFACALTGIEFFAVHSSTGKVNPYAPSLDRINPRRGYTKDNVRIVALSVNMMLLDWGEEIFQQVANNYRRWQRTKRENLFPHFSKSGPHPKLNGGLSNG